MRALCLTLVIAVLLLFSSNLIQAQTTLTKLNQVELMKQWIGIWKAEIGKDTTFIIDCKSFNKGLEFYIKKETKGKIIVDWKTLVGYDKNNDKLIEAAIYGNNPAMLLYSLWFTSANKCEEILLKDVVNPDKATNKWAFEFKSPDLLIWTDLVNNKSTNTYTFHREN